MSIRFLELHAATLAEFAQETRARQQREPDDFWLQMAARNQEDAAAKVARELAQARADESGELLDLRFIGPRADGSISLDAFTKIMDALSKGWKSAAHRLRYGRDDARIAPEIQEQLNLKLAGISSGSTRIFVTGNGMPDLTGESLLQVTLLQTFRLLTASREDFFDAVDAVGGKAAHSMGEAVKAIDAAGLSADFSWQSPNGVVKWHGVHDEVVRIRGLLDTIGEPEEFDEDLRGTVAGLKDTGKLELRVNGKKVAIRYPLAMTAEVQKLAISSTAQLTVRTEKYWDAIGKADIFKRHLVKVVDH